MLVASRPRAATRSSAASSTFLWALALRVRGMSDLNAREEPASNDEQNAGDPDEHEGINDRSKMRCAEEHAPQTVDSVRQRIEADHQLEARGQVGERVQGPGEEEDRH